MTTDELRGLFEKYDAEFLHFEKVEEKFSNRPDLHAFHFVGQVGSGGSGLRKKQ